MSAKPRITDEQRATGRISTARHYLHPFTDFTRARGRGLARHHAAPRASISTIPKGKEILDAMSGLWCVNIGYGRE